MREFARGSRIRLFPLVTEVGLVPVLLLVGAGHAHLHVVKKAAELAAAGYGVHLLAPRIFDYSGIASARAAGALAGDAGRIDVRALAVASGVDFHEGTLESLDAESGVIDGLLVAASSASHATEVCSELHEPRRLGRDRVYSV